MPQLGESVTEGTIGRWLKRPGETVAKYEPLLEVITDKVDTEVPAPEGGTVLEILVGEGETVRVGTVIARIGAPEEAAVSVQPAAPVPASAEQSVGSSATEAAPPGPTAPSASAQPAAPASPPPAQARAVDGAARSGFISPVVARLAAEHGLDLRRITGTGQGGRVTRQDVLRYLEAREAPAPVAPPATPPAPSQPPAAPAAPSQPPVAAPPGSMPAPAASLPEDAELVPLTPMRRSIAEHMERSVRTAPHVTTVMEADLSRVVAHREANQAAFERQGARLTFTPYFVQAVVAGLQQVPVMNGRFTDAGIVLNRRIHIGVAVALDEGLLVPVVRDADEKNLLGLARIINDLAERARTRRLTPDETQGGTFTISNHGVSGSLFATPIINQPQAAILGVGAIVKRPVAVTQHGVDAIAIKPMCYLSLTFDHRIADGATADAFLAAVKAALERV